MKANKSKEKKNTSPPLFEGITTPKNIKDAKNILSKLISAFIKGEVNDQKSKTLCYLINSFVMIVRDNDFENRLQLLETNMKGEK
ncbi:hypothetical protein [Clostridium sp.]|uniref:hypothetical protein n=1 Tax=Clostridium sp. TaxID=1506 RepID=UPI00284B85CF|nr:hypothetical protein [Clostridium sp.]MDR3594274.1 hypothetical protein [Clostridium sp.]